ncbi:MAG: amidohydrolase family protein [Micromonosporaceae bacterium]|nr:amidohydrolase family protein [Micromonosporaceae bacterium]
MRVDLMVHNANILTLHEAHPRAHSMAVHHGRVVALDDTSHLTAAAVLDARGATITPGFADAHNHMAWFGLGLSEIDLSGLTGLHQLYRRVTDRAAQLGPDDYVIGTGYDHTLLGGHPHRADLDAAAGGRPVWLRHRSGHVSSVNTPVLAATGLLDGSTPVPAGGVMAHDEHGPTGVLEEQAQNLVVDLVMPYPLHRLQAAVARASQVYASEGLTHVTEAGIGSGWMGKSPLELAAYQAARDAGELCVRVQLMPTVDALHPVSGHAGDAMTFGLDLGMRTGFGDDWVRLGPMKIWLDGSLVARTAAVLEPFCDHGHGHRHGYFQADPEAMTDQVVAAHAGGWRVACHAIGDRAVDLALEAFEHAHAKHPRPDVRHRIEHAGITRPDQLQRMADPGVIPVPQHHFLYEIGDTMAEAVGADRQPMLYRHASFLAAGLCVPGSSDRPVAPGPPLAGIQSMVLRRTRAGNTLGPDERVDVHTALRAYTIDAAWAAGEEDQRGTLAPGKLADFVLLGDDITAIDPDRIAATEVVATFAGGRCTHGKEAVPAAP